MSKRDDLLLIDDILASFKAIQQYTSGMSYHDFLNNQMCIDAVIRNFEIVGEASNHVSEQFRSEHPEIEWRKLTDFRNRLIHHYFGIYYEIVWEAIHNEVKEYTEILETLL